MKIIIIGGVAAGMSAASKLKRMLPQSQILVLERGGETSYGACGLPYYISGLNDDVDLLRIRKAEAFISQGIDLRLYHQATRIDPEGKEVYFKNVRTGESFSEVYDHLLIASGADSIVPPFPGRELENIFTLKTIADAEAIKAAASSGSVRRVAVIGGGYIGLELVEAFLTLGLAVTVIEMAPRILNGFDKEIADLTQEYLIREGVDLRLNEAVTAFLGKEKLESVETGEGSYPADLAVIAVGVRPNTAFLKESGLAMLPNGALVTDINMRTNLPRIWAAGDCATVRHLLLDRDVYIPLAPGANKQGRYVAENMAGRNKPYRNALGTAFIKVGDLELAKTGLSEEEAKKEELDCESVWVEGLDHAGYYPGASRTYVKLVFDRTDGRLLGAQLLGEKGVALRVNVMAACLTAGMTVMDIGELDLGYAPPYSTPWDILQVAANVAARNFE